jgi:hypothetical protein
LTEMRQSEIQEIYDLAIGYREIDLKAGARK